MRDGRIVRHVLTGQIGAIVKGPGRARRGTRWVVWAGGPFRPAQTHLSLLERLSPADGLRVAATLIEQLAQAAKKNEGGC